MNNKRWIPTVVGVALFMESLDSTIVGVAIPSIAHTFGINPINMKLALTSFLISLAIFVPISGWLADKFRAKNVFCMAILIFTLGSLLCGISTNLEFLILSRVVQGFGAALMLPVARLILLRTHSKAEMVRAFQVMISAALIGPTLGPTVGGLILAVASWHWIFLVNIPIAAIGLFFVWRIVPHTAPPERSAPFDGVGFVFLGIGMATLMYGLAILSEGMDKTASGFSFIGIAAAAFVAYYFRARYQTHRIVEWNLFKTASFRVGMSVNFIVRFTIGTTYFLLPLMLQMVWHLTPLVSGLMFIPYAIGMMVPKWMPIKELLARFGFKRLILCTLLAVSLFAGMMTIFAEPRSLVLLGILLFLQGVAASFLFSQLGPLNYLEVPAESFSQVTSMITMMQQFSGACAITVVAMVLFGLSKGSINALYSPKTFIWVYAIGGLYPLIAFLCALGLRSDLRIPEK